MSERDFLVNVRRIILSAVALIDKRLQLLQQPTEEEKAESEISDRLDSITDCD